MFKIVPTDEQNKVIELSQLHKHLKISAYAGAAKTSTLVMVADANPVPSLMLTFNKSLADEAVARFPEHVECRTTHSLAYASFGAPLQHKLKRPQGAYKNVAGTGSEIAKFFKTGDFVYMLTGERETRRMKAGGVGVAIKETVARFEQSAERSMTYDHVSTSPCDTHLLRDKAAMRKFKYVVLEHAQKLWELRTDLRSPVLATHDTYLKLFQLSNPDLSQHRVKGGQPCQILYLDEVQDVNDVVLDIFLQQMDRMRLYAVGDQYQNIYGWRGAKNGMLALDWIEASLSKSFRFGQEVGDLADVILADDGRIQTSVKGFEKLNTKCMNSFDLPDSFFENTYTMLFRTNGALIQEAVRLLAEGRRVNLEIDVSDFTKLLESAIELFNGNMAKVKHEKLVQFENWNEYKIEAEVVQGELIRVLKLVESGAVYRVLEVLRTHRNCSNPEMTLTTAHKSKGREWDYVILASDFPSCFDKDGVWVGLPDGERNLLYVAATRVKVMLGYNETVVELLKRSSASTQYEDDLDIEYLFDEHVRNQVRQLNNDVRKCLED
jgi:transcription antitermination factor NusG